MRYLGEFWGSDPQEALAGTIKNILRRAPDNVALFGAIIGAKELGINPQGLCRIGSQKEGFFIAIVQRNGRYTLHPPNTKLSDIRQLTKNPAGQARR